MAYNVFLGGRLTGSMGAHFQDHVGIGTSSPAKHLHLYGSSGEVELRLGSSDKFSSVVQKSNAELIIQNASGGDILFYDDSAETMRIKDGGNVGIGVVDPDSALEVLDTSSQLKLSYDGSNATAFTVGSGGDMTIVPSGGEVIIQGNLFPNNDNSRDLGSPAKRWANIYTGDLHLKNDRGDWTILEEEDYLCVINNKTGKKYKMGLIPIKEEDEE
jgi:hypothetical protein